MSIYWQTIGDVMAGYFILGFVQTGGEVTEQEQKEGVYPHV
jgi:hypothetical protein